MKITRKDYHNSGTDVPSFSRHSGASGINGLCSFMGLLKFFDYEDYKMRLS